jgi:predicted nucleic acid-binding protein
VPVVLGEREKLLEEIIGTLLVRNSDGVNVPVSALVTLNRETGYSSISAGNAGDTPEPCRSVPCIVSGRGWYQHHVDDRYSGYGRHSDKRLDPEDRYHQPPEGGWHPTYGCPSYRGDQKAQAHRDDQPYNNTCPYHRAYKLGYGIGTIGAPRTRHYRRHGNGYTCKPLLYILVFLQVVDPWGHLRSLQIRYCGNTSYVMLHLINFVSMRQRLYIDNSVIGGYYDDVFEDATKQLFDRIANKDFEIYFSEVNETELILAPPHIQEVKNLIPADCYYYLELNRDVKILAETYVKEKALGKASMNDAYHIAIASVNRLDCLISWNFKHIVNFDKIRLFNSINLKLGYPLIDIRTPFEFLKP